MRLGTAILYIVAVIATTFTSPGPATTHPYIVLHRLTQTFTQLSLTCTKILALRDFAWNHSKRRSRHSSVSVIPRKVA